MEFYNRSNLLYIIYCFHDIYLTVEFLSLPIKGSDMTSMTTDQQMPTISCVIQPVRTEVVQVQIKVFLGTEHVNILHDFILCNNFILIIFFQVS